MKAFSKLWQCWQRFWEPTDEIPFIVKLLLGVLVVATVAVMVSDSVANCLQQLLSEKDDVLKTIGYCVAGVVSIWLAWTANKRANAIDATAKEQAKATENTEDGQRQERLKNAIEHLGHKSDSVRMGGAYELFHLAKDTRGLRRTVLDILCAHIRQTTGENDYQVKHKTKPSEEIQGLLTLLFIEKHDVFENCPINLQGSYLNGATLSQARLKRASLRQAQLQGAYLNKAQLQKANLWNAQLQYAYIWDAQLQRANLWETHLQGAKLWGAQMQGANLMGAELQRANLWRTHLQGANLSKAQLQGADLMEAQLRGADLWEAQLQGATLWEAQMQGANLSKAQLQGANLSKIQLQGAVLREAQLQGAYLSKAQLQGVSSQKYPHPSVRFESRITDRIGKPSDLAGIIFAGGLQEKDLDTLCEGLSDDQAQALREKLGPHVGEPVSRELPRDSGAETGTYTQEEAEQWIAEYNKAREEAPRADDTADAESAPDNDKNKGD